MPRSTPKELRQRFVDARAATGLTQEQAASALGMSTASVSRKERGEQAVTQRDVVAMEQLSHRGLGKEPGQNAQGASTARESLDRLRTAIAQLNVELPRISDPAERRRRRRELEPLAINAMELSGDAEVDQATERQLQILARILINIATNESADRKRDTDVDSKATESNRA